VLVLIWLAGMGMRLPILAVPPVLPNIRLELGMSETEVGALMGLPLALLAIAAIPGSLLIARLGITFTTVLGLIITAVASAARGATEGVISLYAATIVMGVGIAVMQPAVPPLLRSALPTRIGLGTAVFTNGNLLGATIAVALTIPVVLPLVGQSWRLALFVWSLPVALTAALFALMAPRLGGSSGAPSVPGRWWPDWKSPTIWLLGLTFGSNNSIFFGVNAFLPDYLTHFGRADLITEALSAISVAQLAVTFGMILLAEHMYRRVWPFLVFGPAALIGLIGMIFSSGYGLVGFIALTGAATAVTFVMTLALPPVLSAPGDAHRTAAGMFTISYTCGVLVPIISGALWDLTGIPEMAFLPIGLCTVTLTLLGTALVRRHAA
jgi:CP family cyanate transporter-like MFS transporter